MNFRLLAEILRHRDRRDAVNDQIVAWRKGFRRRRAAKQKGAMKNEVSRAMRWMFICRFYGRPLLETGQRPLMSRFWDHGNSDRHVVGAEEYFDRNDALVG